MPVLNSIAAMQPEIAAWRRDLHANPEIRYEEVRTSRVVAEKLREFGVDEVATGLGRTGVVAVVRGRSNRSGKVIALRADMDALPIHEIATDLPYRSTTPNRMHACGHDGHTAMLLGAAKHLAETRNFDGTAVLVFQPAEEGGAGAQAMLDDGLLERFGVQEFYGMHNRPGLPVGAFALAPGPQMAAADTFVISIIGKGSHAARPQQSADPLIAGAHLVTALQSIVARNVDPLESAVLSVTVFRAGDTNNVIPQTARLEGTVRTFKEEVRDLVEARMAAMVEQIGSAFGVEAQLAYERGYPVLVNDEAATDFAASVARQVSDEVDTAAVPVMGGEDFAFFLQKRPGAFVFVGNGDSAALHHPAYDFNDEAIPAGVSYWAKLVETRMPATAA
jgi:hippurate hydrolase